MTASQVEHLSWFLVGFGFVAVLMQRPDVGVVTAILGGIGFAYCMYARGKGE